MQKDGEAPDAGSPAEQSQGIFSSPELTVSDESVPDPSAISEDEARIAAVFQKHDRSGKQRTAQAQVAREREMQDQVRWEQNVSGQNLQNQATAQEMNAAALKAADIPSTATGDIKLPGEKKRGKTPLVILAIIALLTVCGGVMMLFTGQKQPNVAEPAELSKDEIARQAFSRYASYVLIGEAKDDYSADENIGEAEVEKQFLSPTKNSAFWDTPIELLKNAQNAYGNLGNRDETLTDLMNYYLECLEFLKNYEVYPSISIDTMTATYLHNGRETMINTVNETYATRAVPRNNEKKGSEDGDCRTRRRTQAG